MKKSLWPGLLFISLIAVMSLLVTVQSSVAQTPDPASAKPELVIKLQGIDGRTYEITDMRGSVVLVSFGATWCAPCTAELRALEELRAEYKDKPVKFFWVTVETEDEASNAKVTRYAKLRRVTFPVLRDPMRFAFNQFSPRFKLPMIVFFDKDGQADPTPHFGMSSQPENYKTAMRQRLDRLLATPRAEVE